MPDRITWSPRPSASWMAGRTTSSPHRWAGHIDDVREVRRANCYPAGTQRPRPGFPAGPDPVLFHGLCGDAGRTPRTLWFSRNAAVQHPGRARAAHRAGAPARGAAAVDPQPSYRCAQGRRRTARAVPDTGRDRAGRIVARAASGLADGTAHGSPAGSGTAANRTGEVTRFDPFRSDAGCLHFRLSECSLHPPDAAPGDGATVDAPAHAVPVGGRPPGHVRPLSLGLVPHAPADRQAPGGVAHGEIAAGPRRGPAT